MTAKECSGLLTGRQQEILKLYQEGNSMRKIGSLLGISAKVVHHHLHAAQRKLEEQEELAQLMEEVPGGTTKTIDELRVLAMAGQGMTVREAAASLDRSENSLRYILHRNKISAKEFSKRKLTPEELVEISRAKTPCEEELEKIQDLSLLRLLRAYYEGVSSPELEVVLRAGGLIYRTPEININNKVALNILRAQSKKSRVVVVLTSDDLKAIRKDLKGSGIKWKTYFGAKLICKEKADLDGQEEDIYIYTLTTAKWEEMQRTIFAGMEKLAS